MPREEDEYTARADASAHAAVPPKHSTSASDTSGARWRRSGGKAVSAILFASMWFGESLLVPDCVRCAPELAPPWYSDVLAVYKSHLRSTGPATRKRLA